MPDNAVLLAKIKEALTKDETPHDHIHLRVVGGVVFLDGEAASADESDALEESIKKIDGVTFVQNRLQVNANDAPDAYKPKQPGHN